MYTTVVRTQDWEGRMSRRIRWVTALTIVLALGLVSGAIAQSVQKITPTDGPFQRTWARSDKPVADGVVARTWMWGPEAIAAAVEEDYADAPGGKRLVQYFDK